MRVQRAMLSAGERSMAIGDLKRWDAERLTSSGLVACDIETSGLDPHGDEIGTVQFFAYGVGAVVVKVEGDKRPENICGLLENEQVQKVFHHAPFDLRFMVAKWGIEPRNIACTKIASKLVDRHASADEHSLKHLLWQHLGISLDKGQRRSNWLAAELTDEQLRYACADVESLIVLLQHLQGRLEELGLEERYEDCLQFLPTRVHLDLGGWSDVFLY